MEFGTLLRHLGVMNFVLNLSCLINIQGREPYFCDFVKERKKKNKKKQKKIKTTALQCWLEFGHLRTSFFQPSYDDRDHWTLHFNVSLNDIYSLTQLYENQKLLCLFPSQIYGLIRMKFSTLQEPVSLLELTLNLTRRLISRERTPHTWFYKMRL